MGCKYFYNGQTYNSYNELAEVFTDSDLSQVNDLLYSKDEMAMDLQNSDLYEDYTSSNILSKPQLNPNSVLQGEGLNTYSGSMSERDLQRIKPVISYLTSPDYTDNSGNSVFSPISNEQYFQQVFQKIIQDHAMTEAEATKYCEQLLNQVENFNEATLQWQKAQQLAGRYVAYKKTEKALGSTYNSVQEIAGWKQEAAHIKNIDPVEVYNIVEGLINDTTPHSSSIVGEPLFSPIHINGSAQSSQIIIATPNIYITDNQGSSDIHVYLPKTTLENPKYWGEEKIKLYQHEVGLIKKMVHENRGRIFRKPDLKEDNVYVHIVPIQLELSTTDSPAKVIRHPNMDIQPHEEVQKIQSKNKLTSIPPLYIGNATLDGVDAQLQFIFPRGGVHTIGINTTASQWVESNWKYFVRWSKEKKAFVFRELEKDANGKYQYKVLSDHRIGSKNEELVSFIQRKLEDDDPLYKGFGFTEKTVKDLKYCIERGDFSLFSSKEADSQGYSAFIKKQFSKYIQDTVTLEDGTTVSKWQVWAVPELEKAGVLLLRNKETAQVDVFLISSKDLSITYTSKFGRKNLLGDYIDDINNERFTMQYNEGNVEAIRACTLINAVLPAMGDVKLGGLQIIGPVVGTRKRGTYFDFSALLPHWHNLVTIVNGSTKANIQNNLIHSTCISSEEIMLQLWNSLMNDTNSISDNQKKWFRSSMTQPSSNQSLMEELLTLHDIDTKIEKVQEIIDGLRFILEHQSIDISNLQELRSLSINGDFKQSTLANLFITALKTLNSYYGDLSLDNEYFSGIQEYFMKTSSIENSNVRKVSTLVLQTIDRSRRIITEYVNKNMRGCFDKFYQEAHYSKFRNAVIGDQANVYRNMFQTDANGENLFLFKDPYDNTNDLLPHEREFLKHYLYEMYKVKWKMKGTKDPINISGINDPKLVKGLEMPEDYLWVPLEKASASTLRSKIFTDPDVWAQQKYGRIKSYFNDKLQYERDSRDLYAAKDEETKRALLSQLSPYNKFNASMSSRNNREKLLNSKGPDFFETNLEHLFIDFVETQVQSVEWKKTMVRIRGIELAVLAHAASTGETSISDRVLKQIDDYVLENVYQESSMETGFKKFDIALTPFKRFVSTVYIAGNLVGTVRDTIQGLAANFMRALIKFQTNVNISDVLFGYRMILSEGITNRMNASLINQMNIRWAFSNFDAAHVSERLKSGISGICNYENWMYSTLRGPDYMNRMVLFIAQLHHDGAWNAYSLDSAGRLTYDWRKDERFSAYAKGDTSNPEYNKQKSLYMSMIRAFNIEDSTLHLSYEDNLPDAYTTAQIRSIKTVGESIYGAYDKASKQKVEMHAIGHQFLYFFTWMNGMIDDYFKSTQISENEIEQTQETNYNGELLYFNPDGTITTENTGVPVLKWVPIMVQGVFQTFKDYFHAAQTGDWKAFDEIMWSGNKMRQRNLKRALSDLLAMLIVGVLIKGLLGNEYREHKKNDSGADIFSNIAWEFAYKSTRNAFDVFDGPLVIGQYFGESTNPAAYTTQKRLITDIYHIFTGDRSLGDFTMNSQAFFRGFQDTYKMYQRDVSPKKKEVKK